MLGCGCSVCTSESKTNKRTRTCLLLEKGGKKVLLDPGPDTYQQLLEHPINRLDGVMITHCHYDHIGGYDDLRVLSIKQQECIPTLIHKRNTEELRRRCGYLFRPGASFFSLNELDDDGGSGEFQGFSYRYLTYTQNGMNVTGFILDDIAFVSDIQTVDEALCQALHGVGTLIVSCIVKENRQYKSHLNLNEIATLRALTGSPNVILTHLGHDVDYLYLSQNLGAEMLLSYDGFTFEAS